MDLTSGNLSPLAIGGALTLLAALLTVVGSVAIGAALAYQARASWRYGAILALLFVPFSIGGSVWAYSAARLALWSGLQQNLVSAGTLTRAIAVLGFCLARSLPLGIFFCATSLQRYTSDLRPYFQAHQLSVSFFLLCGLNRIQRSLLMLLGLFGGALMASEASLPIFLYRANPGTGPETANILLSRIFREIYASLGPQSLSAVADFGNLFGLLLLVAALIGTFLGICLIGWFRGWLQGAIRLGRGSNLFGYLLRGALYLMLLPGLLALASLFFQRRVSLEKSDAFDVLFGYREIVALGALVACSITGIGFALAVRLRYSRRDMLSIVERSSLAACLLMLPAYIPVLSIVSALGWFFGGPLSGSAGFISLYLSHVALHFSIFQFICISLIASIPERHVAWQRSMRLRYTFSLVTDGFRRHAAVTVALLGLGTVQVVTDGSVSRWFSHLVRAPEEALYAAVFGRLSNSYEAALVAWSVAAIALVVCCVLAAAYVLELKVRPRYG